MILNICFFFYWKDENTFVLSKTKIITIASYIIFVIIFCIYDGFEDIFASIGVCLFLAIPIFLVGYFIHTNKNKTTNMRPIKKEPMKNNDKSTKEQNNDKNISQTKFNDSEFNKYYYRINKLKIEFNTKDNNIRQLVEETFQPPQLTYDRFISYLDKCKNNLFYSQIDVIETIITLASKDSIELDNEIEKK